MLGCPILMFLAGNVCDTVCDWSFELNLWFPTLSDHVIFNTL